MTKTLAVIVVLAVVIQTCLAQRDSKDMEMRLIEFNETQRSWMPQWKVVEISQECGKGVHSGFMDITDAQSLAPEGLPQKVRERLEAAAFPAGPTHQSVVNPLIKLLSKDKMIEYNNKLSSYFTRYYTTTTGKDAAHWIHKEFETHKDGRKDVHVEFFEHSWLQPSVIGRIAGSGDHADEVVIIGAHEDSINGGGSKRSPGADDDASGTCTVMELYRVLVSSGFQPDRTIEFHTYSAEEVGLRGSQAIAQAYQKAGVPVYAMMQLDMTMYVKKGTTPTFGVFTDYVNPSLTAFLRTLVPVYSELQVTNSQCGYGCSDHASWTKAGYAACFPSESTMANSDPKIHTDQDLLSILDVDHGLEIAKVALGYLVELSLV